MLLECGHTLCEDCCRGCQQYDGNIKCPFDKKTFYRNVDSLPVNYLAIELLEKFSPANLEKKAKEKYGEIVPLEKCPKH
jgi:hypothetical protein